MVNRDNLTAELDIFCASISVAKSQWEMAEAAMRHIRSEIPGIKFNIPGRWNWHNGGYYYKEIAIGHKYPGRAFQAMKIIEQWIRHIQP